MAHDARGSRTALEGGRSGRRWRTLSGLGHVGRRAPVPVVAVTAMVAVVLVPAAVVVAPVAGLHGRRLASVVRVASAHGGVASRRGRGAVAATVCGGGGWARSAAA